MNEEIKKQWVNALRSGEYIQGHGRLRRYDTYCCLGVLCDLHRKATGKQWREYDAAKSGGVMMYPDNDDACSSTTLVPAVVMQWAGLTSSNPIIGKYSLALRNDSLNHSFVTIADAIEKGL